MTDRIPFTSHKTGESLKKVKDKLVSPSGEEFIISQGIPRFTGVATAYSNSFGYQWKKFKQTQLDSYNGTDISLKRLENLLGFKMGKLKGKTVLEAGCGAGRFTEHLIKSGAEVYSIDASVAVEANLENLAPLNISYTLAQADILNLPFAKGSFDFVLCAGVIQHLPTPQNGIKALWEMVKPGGQFIFDHYSQPTYKLPMISSAPYFRSILKRLPPDKAWLIVDKITETFFPFQWAYKGRNRSLGFRFINRLSPCLTYFDQFPELSKNQHLEWSKLDTFDSLTDYFKHRASKEELSVLLKGLGISNFSVEDGGNGVQVRATKT